MNRKEAVLAQQLTGTDLPAHQLPQHTFSQDQPQLSHWTLQTTEEIPPLHCARACARMLGSFLSKQNAVRGIF